MSEHYWCADCRGAVTYYDPWRTHQPLREWLVTHKTSGACNEWAAESTLTTIGHRGFRLNYGGHTEPQADGSGQ